MWVGKKSFSTSIDNSSNSPNAVRQVSNGPNVVRPVTEKLFLKKPLYREKIFQRTRFLQTVASDNRKFATDQQQLSEL